MKKNLILTCLCLVSMLVSAQNTSLKEAYKNYFSVGVAVNQRNISVPEQQALIKAQYHC